MAQKILTNDGDIIDINHITQYENLNRQKINNSHSRQRVVYALL